MHNSRSRAARIDVSVDDEILTMDLELREDMAEFDHAFGDDWITKSNRDIFEDELPGSLDELYGDDPFYDWDDDDWDSDD